MLLLSPNGPHQAIHVGKKGTKCHARGDTQNFCKGDQTPHCETRSGDREQCKNATYIRAMVAQSH